MTVPFTYSNHFSTQGIQTGTWAEYWHTTLPTQVFAANGYCILLNGYNTNARLADLTDAAGSDDNAVYPLQMGAPSDEMYPLLSAVGTGKVYGNGLKWRLRFRNSKTGEVSGMSPIPDEGLNVGTEIVDGSNSYLGQTAYFRMSQTSDPLYQAYPGSDEVQLLRNTAGQDELWYVVDTQTISTTVTFTDNTPDEDLVFNELASVLPCPDFGQSLMPPVAKAFLHPSGRVWYYGTRKMGKYGLPGTVSLTATTGENYFYLPAAGTETVDPIPVFRNRVGQKLIVGTTGEEYRITQVHQSGVITRNVYFVYPPAETTGGTTWYIEDDRDTRAIYMSEPGLPWCIDPLKTVYIGADTNDEVYNIFTLHGRTYVQTRRRIYAVINDYSEDPSLTLQIQAVSEEGTVGFNSGCVTPFGYVYLHPTLGVRLFDGVSSMALPAKSAYDDFQPKTQFDDIDPSFITETLVVWDVGSRKVYVSYIPNGNLHHRGVLSFSPDDGNWRGPHFMNIYSAGSMFSSTSDETTVFGDDFSNLFQMDQQALDMVPSVSGMTLTGSVASVANLQITVTSATFDPSSDHSLRGCPIFFTRVKNGSTSYFRGRIHSVVSATTLQLESSPFEESTGAQVDIAISGTETWAFTIGAIRWYAETAYVDAGEPIQPKTVERIRLRWERPASSGSDTFTVGDDAEDTGTFSTEGGAGTETSVDPTGNIYGDVRIRVNGVAHKFRFRGTSETGHPKITAAVADIDVRSGVRRND